MQLRNALVLPSKGRIIKEFRTQQLCPTLSGFLLYFTLGVLPKVTLPQLAWGRRELRKQIENEKLALAISRRRAICFSAVAIGAWFYHDRLTGAIFTLMACGYYKEWRRIHRDKQLLAHPQANSRSSNSESVISAQTRFQHSSSITAPVSRIRAWQHQGSFL
jgi:hypothetical protein